VCGSFIDDVAAVMAIGCSRGKYFPGGQGEEGLGSRLDHLALAAKHLHIPSFFSLTLAEWSLHVLIH
jgi:hypothetical protein